MPAETSGRGLGVMIAVPVFPPCRDLQRAKPPDVLAGIDSFGQTRLQVKQAVYKTLHMEAIEQPDRAEPEESGPAEEEVSKTERDHDERSLELGPDRIPRLHQVRAPLLHAGGFPLVQPAQVSPPEAAMPRARYIIQRVRICMMVSVVRDPCARCA